MWLAVLALGCGAGPTVAGTPPLDVPVVPPWSGWALPLEGGRVITCNSGLLTAHFEPGRVGELAPAWRSAFVAAGFVETLDHSEGGLVAYRFEHGPTRILELSVVPLPDTTIVSAVLVPEWTDAEAAAP
jgi:hypothetical protein